MEGKAWIEEWCGWSDVRGKKGDYGRETSRLG